MPPFWQATICEGPICYEPGYNVHIFSLGPGESTTLDFAITAAVEEGKGTSTVTLESLNDPGVTETNSFSIITSGLEVLTVDADGGADYETYYLDAITAAGRTTADWTRSYMGPLTAVDMANFTAVVWAVGEQQPGSERRRPGGTGRLRLERRQSLPVRTGSGHRFLPPCQPLLHCLSPTPGSRMSWVLTTWPTLPGRARSTVSSMIPSATV